MEQDDVKPARVPVPGADKGGAWVRMGDKEYKIAPLNFKALREMAGGVAMLQKMEKGAMPSAEHIGVLGGLAHAALKRNYPGITQDEVEDGLDFGNFVPILNALMGASGLNNKKEAQPGEIQASPQ